MKPTPTPDVRIFCTETDSLDGRAIADLMVRLPDDEERRAKAFAFDRDRRTYVAAHVLLRRALCDELAGEEPRFVTGPHGRPELADTQRRRGGLSFNLTHTYDFAACAISRDMPVGIDAENTRRSIDIDAISGRWFAVSERRLLKQLLPEDRIDAFFRIWTLKEAILKAAGLGLQISPELFAVDPVTGGTIIPSELQIPTQWRIAQLTPAPHIRLAVAVPGTGDLHPTLTQVKLT